MTFFIKCVIIEVWGGDASGFFGDGGDSVVWVVSKGGEARVGLVLRRLDVLWRVGLWIWLGVVFDVVLMMGDGGWGGLVGGGFEGLVEKEGVFHFADGGSAFFAFFPGEHLIDKGGGIVGENVGGSAGFGEEFGADGGGGVVVDGVTFGVDDVGEEGEAVIGFLGTDVASAGAFDDFRGRDGDGGIALAGHPNASAGFGVEGDDGGEVGFHGLIFFEGEGKSGKESDEREGDEGERNEEVGESPGKREETTENNEVDELAEGEGAEEFVVCLNILGDFIGIHRYILA